MKSVFVLQHEYEWCGRDDVKFIGVYSTREDAETATKRLRNQPGFCDWPDGFSIEEYSLNEDHWCEGFSTMIRILVRTTDPHTSYVAASCAWHPGGHYEICSIGAVDDEAELQFSVGQIVRCSEQLVEGSVCLVAESLAR